jgi:hypothetical protein
MRLSRALVALALAALALSGCESTQEESARLEAKAKRERAEHPLPVQKRLQITHASTRVKVLDATLVHDAEGAAAAVVLRNMSARTLRDVPIAITVTDANGRALYRNNAPGLEPALTAIASLPAHSSLTWVDDQIPAPGQPATIQAIAGEAPAAKGPPPRIEASAHLTEASAGEASGTVHNRSSIAQTHLVVYLTARRAGRIVAAGRAIVAQLAASSSAPFNAYLIGSPAGARLQASAPG